MLHFATGGTTSTAILGNRYPPVHPPKAATELSKEGNVPPPLDTLPDKQKGKAKAFPFLCLEEIIWSTGWGSNPRILVLQTSALATSPPVLLAAALLRLCGGTQIRLHRLVAREDFVRIFVGNRAGDDHIIALLPVRRRCDLVLRRQLH